MFSPQGNDNLISNNASAATNSALYSFNDSRNLADKYSGKHENKKGAFANFARISNFDDEIGWSSNMYNSFGTSKENPLEKNVYNYSMSSAGIIRGMAFANGGRGFVENPLAKPYKIVDNTYEFSRAIKNNDFNDVINVTKVKKAEYSNKVEIAPVAYNTYRMSDILKETDASQIIDFSPIPKELALVKTSKWRSFWGNQVEFIKHVKNMFMRSKVK